MADQQLKDLTANTTPNDADILYVVVDPAGTPLDRKITWTTIKAFFKTYFDTLYQGYLGFTPENVANKSTSVSTDGTSDTKYPSVKAVKDYADGLVEGLLDYRGGYDASGNTYPTTGGSGTGGAVKKGDMWVVSVQGTLGGEVIHVGDSIIANVDTPAQTASNWNHLNSNISYVPEDVANKKTTMTGNTTSDTFYLTAKAIYDWATGLFQTLANKVTSFQVTPDDSHYPSEKLVKDSLDAKASLTGTETLTNKRITKRVASATDDSTAVIDCDSYDEYYLTAIANNTTISITGTPTNGQTIFIGLKDAGATKTLTWTSITGLGVTLPTDTTAGKQHIIGLKYIASAWRAIAVSVEE